MTSRTPGDGRGRSRLSPEERRERARRAAVTRWERERAAQRAETTVHAELIRGGHQEPDAEHGDVEGLLGDTITALTGLADQGFNFSAYVPARYRDRFIEATESEERLSNHQMISLVDLRVSMLLERVDTAESGQRWQECKAAMRELTVAMRSGQQEAVAQAFADLNTAVNRGVADHHNWQEIMNSIEVRRRVTETELKRIKAAEEFMSAAEALEIIQVIAESVNRHVQDAVAKALVQADIERAIGAAGN